MIILSSFNIFLFLCAVHHRVLPSFPTRRSSDLRSLVPREKLGSYFGRRMGILSFVGLVTLLADRKSTRLNSSHLVISYAVFCLKKKITPCDYILMCYIRSA